jgi:hypothetical protein
VPAGHLIADKLCLFGQAGLPDRGAELAQLVPNLVALARAVAVKPVRRRHHAGIMPHTAVIVSAASVRRGQ